MTRMHWRSKWPFHRRQVVRLSMWVTFHAIWRHRSHLSWRAKIAWLRSWRLRVAFNYGMGVRQLWAYGYGWKCRMLMMMATILITTTIYRSRKFTNFSQRSIAAVLG